MRLNGGTHKNSAVKQGNKIVDRGKLLRRKDMAQVFFLSGISA
jgi:hypothetical protein